MRAAHQDTRTSVGRGSGYQRIRQGNGTVFIHEGHEGRRSGLPPPSAKAEAGRFTTKLTNASRLCRGYVGQAKAPAGPLPWNGERQQRSRGGQSVGRRSVRPSAPCSRQATSCLGEASAKTDGLTRSGRSDELGRRRQGRNDPPASVPWGPPVGRGCHHSVTPLLHHSRGRRRSGRGATQATPRTVRRPTATETTHHSPVTEYHQYEHHPARMPRGAGEHK
jgi:hypothetical protein